MLSLARQTTRGDRGIRNGQWLKKELKGTELRGKYLGIIGMGNIGKRLGRLGKALNMNIIGYDVIPIDEEFSKEVGLMKADLNTLLQSSDYVSIHVPLLDSTYHLIDAQKISTMKKTAKIINTVITSYSIHYTKLYDAGTHPRSRLGKPVCQQSVSQLSWHFPFLSGWG